MICAGSEVNRSSGGVIEGPDSESPRYFQVTVKMNFKNPSTECSRFGGPFDATVELVCFVHALFAQLIQHLR